MKVIYSAQRNGFVPGNMYRNPRYFERVNTDGVNKITVIGDWPNVVAAYEAAGIEVTQESVSAPVQKDPDPPHDDGFPPDEELRAAIHAETGKAPHWKSSREKLIAQYEAMNNAPDR